MTVAVDRRPRTAKQRAAWKAFTEQMLRNGHGLRARIKRAQGASLTVRRRKAMEAQ